MKLTTELKQTQKISPQVIQTMELLQMGTQELRAYIDNALLENPLLELENEKWKDARVEISQKLDWLGNDDRQNQWYYQEDSHDAMMLVAAPTQESLYDYLHQQLDWEQMGRDLAAAVECVLTGLNHAGYLEETREELAARCNQPTQLVARAEALVQSLDPAGVGARTLSECLTLQLEREGENGLPLTIVQCYLEDMARSHYHHIAKEIGADRKAIQDACQKIRALDPKPGRPYAPHEGSNYVVADVLVTERDGKLIVTVGDEFQPVVKVSPYYHHLLKEEEDPEVGNYLMEKVRQARWLIKSIDQRKNTLLSCGNAIVAYQEAFFRHGAAELRPMTLADVAKEMGVHESTVSRTIKDKYLQCGQGVLPLSYFFSRPLAAITDEGIAPEKAKEEIRTLIEKEDRKKPLSDQKLCDILAQKKVILSRRTVAKYRDEMGIPPASGRKIFGEE